MSFGVPTDPSYLAFRDGLLVANDDVIDKFRWRWSAAHSKWYTYSIDAWILDDVAIPDTSAGSGFELIRNDEADVEKARADLWLPDLFRRLVSDAAKYRDRWPNLVWTWRNGGDWRVAQSRSGAGTPDETGGGDWETGLTPECVKRVKDVREWIRRGVITAVDGQRLIREIVAECT